VFNVQADDGYTGSGTDNPRDGWNFSGCTIVGSADRRM